MYTVEQLASKPSIWRTITPFEKSFLRSLRPDHREQSPEDHSTDRWDLISESSFYLASSLFDEDEALSRALTKVSRLKGGRSTALSKDEIDVAKDLGTNIASFVNRDPSVEVSWMPAVPGLGSLKPSEADVIVGRQLIEIKNVDRQFSPRDLRQILLYSTALTISGCEISSICIANFRLYRFVNVELHTLAVHVSGRSWIELRTEIEWLLLELTPPSIY